MKDLNSWVCDLWRVTLVFLPPSVKVTVQTKKGQKEVELSPLPKRAKRPYLAMDTDHEIIGYVVPVFRAK